MAYKTPYRWQDIACNNVDQGPWCNIASLGHDVSREYKKILSTASAN